MDAVHIERHIDMEDITQPTRRQCVRIVQVMLLYHTLQHVVQLFVLHRPLVEYLARGRRLGLLQVECILV